MAVSSVNYITLSYLTPYQIFALQLVSKKFYNRFVPYAENLVSLESANKKFGVHKLVRGCIRKAFFVQGGFKGVKILYLERQMSKDMQQVGIKKRPIHIETGFHGEWPKYLAYWN